MLDITGQWSHEKKTWNPFMRKWSKAQGYTHTSSSSSSSLYREEMKKVTWQRRWAGNVGPKKVFGIWFYTYKRILRLSKHIPKCHERHELHSLLALRYFSFLNFSLSLFLACQECVMVIYYPKIKRKKYKNTFVEGEKCRTIKNCIQCFHDNHNHHNHKALKMVNY